jgi:hypothetical protein
VGRIVGIAIFWLLLCYVIGMSALSIIPSLFWPELGPRPHAPRLEQCAKEIADLDRELLEKTAESLRHRGPRRQLWLHEWDGRFMALAGGCGPLEGARADLLKLRTGVEALLRRYQGDALRTQERIWRAIDQVSGPHG